MSLRGVEIFVTLVAVVEFAIAIEVASVIDGRGSRTLAVGL